MNPNPNYPNRWKSFLPISLVTIITTLDSSVVNVSLPVIAEQLGSGIGIVEWVVLTYLLAVASLLLIFGRLGDTHGRRNVYQVGIVLFTAASALCGFSQNVTMLIASRTLQGIGAALIIANGPALIGEIFPPQERGKALGLLGTTVSVGLSIGPALGGFITSWLGWRYIFFLNLPLGALTAYLVGRNIRSDTVFTRTRFDLSGGAMLALGLLGLLLALSRGSEWGWNTPATLALVVSAIILLWLFLFIESRRTDPLLELALFKNRTFRGATLAGFLAFASLMSQTFLLPFYLIQLRGFEPAHAGLFLMAVPLVMSVAAPLSGSLSDKIGTRGLCVLGLLIQGCGFILLSLISDTTPQLYIAAPLMVLGLGIGIFNAPNNSELLSSVPRERLGNASGILGLTRTLGMSTGMALSSAIFLGVRNTLVASASSDPSAAFLSGLDWAFWTAAALAWLGALVVQRRGKDRTEHI